MPNTEKKGSKTWYFCKTVWRVNFTEYRAKMYTMKIEIECKLFTKTNKQYFTDSYR